MTDTRESSLAREALLSGTATLSVGGIAREVLLSQVTQTWASTIAREVLLSVPGITGTLSATDPRDTASFAGSVIPVGGAILSTTEAQDIATMTGNVTQPLALPPGVPNVPQGDVVAMDYNQTQDYPRLVYTAPRFEVVAIADIIEPSVLEAVEGMLPTLVPPYVTAAANTAVQNLAVQLVGSTMTGPLMLSPPNPTAPTMAATKQYVDSMVATVVPEVPPVPANQAWARETGQWVPLAGGGTVTNIATGAGLTGGPITATGTIAMANMAANSLKGNNTGAVAAPTDIPAGNVLTMIGAAPLNSPVFTGSPSLPTGTAAITQPGGTANTTVATTAFVASSLGSYAPLASPVFTGAPSLPTGSIGVTQTAGTSNTSLATTAFVAGAVTAGTANYLPLTGGRLSGGLASGVVATPVPPIGALTLNSNAVQPTSDIGGYLKIITVDNGSPQISLDCYGTGNSPTLTTRHARGTGAAPTATQANDYLFNFTAAGYTGSSYPPFAVMSVQASENWTTGANGSQLVFNTTPSGTTAPVASLNLRGNSATFSPGTTINSQGISYYGYGQYISFGFTSPSLAVNSNGTWVGNLVPSTSDPRLKTGVTDVSADALSIINEITLSQFDLTVPGQEPRHFSVGFMSDQLTQLVPEAVHAGDGDGTFDSLDLLPLVSYLVGAVQQLTGRLITLEGRA